MKTSQNSDLKFLRSYLFGVSIVTNPNKYEAQKYMLNLYFTLYTERPKRNGGQHVSTI